MAQKLPKIYDGGLTRRTLLKSGVCAGLALGFGGCKRPLERRKYNVVLISLDTVRADHLSSYGYGKSQTPFIDALAAQGHRFEQAYTTVPTTLPAHASLFCSLYPRQLSVLRNHEHLSQDALMLSEILQAEGYATGGFVSTTVLGEQTGFAQGFDTYVDTALALQRPAEKTLEKALPWLKAATDHPFFFFIHFFDPHTPYNAPKPFRRRIGASLDPHPPDSAFVEEPSAFTPEVIRDSIAAYDVEIAYTDWIVGKLLEAIPMEDTLVVLLSDHGETLGELLVRYGYAFDHGEFLYTHQLHIPLIIRLPGKGKEMVHPDPVSILDVMPTILDLIGIDTPTRISGRSLLPLMEGERIPPRPVFAERRRVEKAVRPYLDGDSYTIIHRGWQRIHTEKQAPEVYELGADPLENLHGRHEAEGLEGKLEEMFSSLKPLYGPSVVEQDEEALKRLRELGYTD